MKEIKLTQGKVTIVDDGIYEELSKYKWHARKGRSTFYAVRDYCFDGKKITIWMHRFIMNSPKENHVDHINHDGLDNRKSNLRFANNSENLCNRGINRNNQLGFKGVRLMKNQHRLKPYEAQIQLNGRNRYIGMYATPEEAARAYDKAAKELHGEYAFLNFKYEEHEDD